MIPCKTELKKYRAKNSKILKRIWIKPCSKTRSDKSTCANILTVLFRHCLGMNATSCYWSYIDFYTLITYNYILTDTSNSDTEFISRPLTCLKNFENFTGKHLCRSLFSTKLQAFRPKKTRTQAFPVKFEKFWRIPILKNIWRTASVYWLLYHYIDFCSTRFSFLQISSSL